MKNNTAAAKTPRKDDSEEVQFTGSRREWLAFGLLVASGITQGFSRSANAAPLSDAVPAADNLSAQPGTKREPLDDFIYDLENSPGGWQGAYGSAKEATVEEFPLSQSIAGVSMRLKPGGFRELHWHSIAAEWAYVLEGRVRTTVISPNGTTATDDFDVGDIWYFPKGHGHMLQCIGDKPCHFLLGFDNGHFSEFGTFSVTDWLSHTKPEIVARNLQLPVGAVQRFPHKELYIGSGQVAGNEVPQNIEPAIVRSQTAHKFSLLNMRPTEFAGGSIRIVSQEDFPINSTLSSALMTLKPGAFRELHWHPNADEWQYVIKGSGRVSIFGSHSRVKTMDYSQGKVAFIKQGYGHFLENTGSEDLELLILFNTPVYQEISLSAWLAANPAQLVADHFGLSPKLVAELPKHGLGIAGWQKKTQISDE
ncbi:MAG: oxalate decarboxylase [Prosthecobacter sp.]|nr:oxalate decarboxylase [Prosthecobacter sp.]